MTLNTKKIIKKVVVKAKLAANGKIKNGPSTEAKRPVSAATKRSRKTAPNRAKFNSR